MGKGLYTYNSIDKIEFCDSSEEDTDINYDCIEAIRYKPVVGKFDYEITEDGLIVEKKNLERLNLSLRFRIVRTIMRIFYILMKVLRIFLKFFMKIF